MTATKNQKTLVCCERCRRIRKLFQYTKFRDDFSQGLCEDCAVEINKKLFDLRKIKEAREEERMRVSILLTEWLKENS